MMVLTETKTYKKTSTKTNTKTKTHRQRQIKSDSKTQCMPYLSTSGVQGFKILYWLSSCDGKDKDPILCIIRVEYFSGGEYFPGVNAFSSGYFLGVKAEYFSGVNFFQGLNSFLG